MDAEKDIIDRRALAIRLEELAGWSGVSAKTRPQLLAILKEAQEEGRAEVQRRFAGGTISGWTAVKANMRLMDVLVGAIYEVTTQYVYPVANPTKGEQIAIVATGGYGRGQMAPFSDVDLLFLLPYKRTPHAEQVAEYMLYLLWDLGLKVGHATRSIDDCVRLANGDLTIRTSLLDARFLWGDRALFEQFQERFQAEVVAPYGTRFVEEKLAERDSRHERMGDSRYVLEPNVKEGKGGLRDLQSLFWIAKFLYGVDHVGELVKQGILTRADGRRFRKARNFLWTVRCHLHYLAGRPEERLSFNVQSVIGRRMGYADRTGALGVERFMKHYFLVAKDVGDLTRVLCAVWEEQHTKRRRHFRLPSMRFGRRGIDGFKLDGDRLTVASDDAFQHDPLKLLRLFAESQRHDLDIHPRALRLAGQSLKLIDRKFREAPEANRLFLEMLCSPRDPETTLRRLNETGLIGRFIPDFGRVVAQMQYDMYHVFTVDEHTIRAIGILHRIERGEMCDSHPVACQVVHEVRSRRALYVALLLHDIAKGRGGNHSEIGARIAKRLGPRLGLDPWETETVVWLVRHHLAMSRTAFKRDLEDPQTVGDFVDIVQSPERLRLLMVLTVADIRAVGPEVWNGWKAALLQELYELTLEAMTGGVPTEFRQRRVEEAREALRQRLAAWPAKDVEAHLARGYPSYWLAFDTDTLVHHAELLNLARREDKNLLVEHRLDKARDVTRIVVYAPDHAGLFAQIAGAMALCDASIVNARIATLADGMALDSFDIQDARGNAFADPGALKRLAGRIEAAVCGRLHVVRELEAHRRALPAGRVKAFNVAPKVIIDNRASSQNTLIEVNGRDRVGFLYDVTQALTELGVQIATARIATYGERVVDVFYVKDLFGLKIEHPDKLAEIERRLREAVAGPDDAATEEAASAAAR